MEYSATSLGREIRGLREQCQLSQEALGREAGYGKGAGVSISRIESGATRPTMLKLFGIAGALGVTPERLEQMAREREGRTGSVPERDSGASDRIRTVDDKRKDIEERTKKRTDLVLSVTASLEKAHDRARDAYFLRLVDISKGIDGAPPPKDHSARSGQPLQHGVRHAGATVAGMKTLSSEIAALLLGGAGGLATGAGLGGTAAYATFAAVAKFGTASTGTPIASLAGVAASNATLARLGGGTLASGGGGVATGSLVLTSIVAAPMVMLFAGGLYLAHRKNKAQEAALKSEINLAEQSLNSTQAGFDLLVDTILRATKILEYIGAHATHALEKWAKELGEGPVEWDSLTPAQRQRHRDFIDIAACELAVDSIDSSKFMTTGEEDMADLTAAIAATLNYSEAKVHALV